MMTRKTVAENAWILEFRSTSDILGRVVADTVLTREFDMEYDVGTMYPKVQWVLLVDDVLAAYIGKRLEDQEVDAFLWKYSERKAKEGESK